MFSEQLSFLDTVAPVEARYKAVAALTAGAGFRQEFYMGPQVKAAISRHSASGANTYVSLCDYVKPCRAGEFVFGFTAFGFDVDCHGSKNPALDAQNAYDVLKKKLFGRKNFPEPSMVEHTGRGLLILVAFKRVPKQVLPLWLRMGEAMAERIREVLPSYATLDSTYGDAARVVRVPGTFNTAAGRKSRILDYTQHFPLYELSYLRDRYFPHLNPKNFKDKPSRGKRGASNILFTDGALKLHVDRLDDLVKLCEMRHYNLIGLRELILFLYRYWTCFYIGPESALDAAINFNQRFQHPLRYPEVSRATRSAERAFHRWRLNKETGYNYRNSTLINMLNITPTEQESLRTIISPAEKARRRALKHQWSNRKRDEARAEERGLRRERIMGLLNEGFTRDQICAEVGCSPNTVAKVAREVTREVTEGYAGA